MTRKQHRRTAALLISLALLLSGCGTVSDTAQTPQASEPETEPETEITETAAPSDTGSGKAEVPQSTESPREQTGYAYEVSWTPLDMDGMTPEDMFAADGRMLLAVALDTGDRGICDPETGTLLMPEGLDGEILAVTAAGSDLWYCAETDAGIVLSRSDGDSILGSVALPDSEGFYPYGFAVGGDGSFYLMDSFSLRVYSASGRQLSEFTLDGEYGISLTRLSSGQVVLTTRAGGTGSSYAGAVRCLNTESVGASLTSEETGYTAYAGWNGTVLLSDGGSLYTLDLEENIMETVLDWIDTDVNPDGIVSVTASGPETIYVLRNGSDGASLGTLTRVEAAETEETVLQVGYCLSSTELRSILNALAVEWNTSGQEFRVHLVNYGILTDGAQRLQEDADKLDLVFAGTDVLDAADLTDLADLFDAEVGPDTLFPGVYEAMTESGNTAALPLYFTVRTAVGIRGMAGDGAGWTPAEMASAAEENPDAVLLQYSNAYDTLSALLEYTGSWVTDFASLLEAVSGVPVDDADLYLYPANTESGAVSALQSGDLLLLPVEITGFSDLLTYEAALGDELVWKGYPTDTGNGSVLCGSASCVLGIPASSDLRDAAWSFLKRLLTDDSMVQFQQSCGFPVLEAGYDAAEAEAMQGIRYTDEDGETVVTGGQRILDGNVYDLEPLDEDGAAAFREYLDGACGFVYTADATASLRSEARSALQAVLEGGQDPETAAQSISGN